MEDRQGYDVLRIVVHSNRCYMSKDYIVGKQLIVWLKYHSRIEKECLFGWIHELIENLEHFHQCRGNPCYQYVNPYSIIVGEDSKLYLLDLGSKAQDELLHLMQRRYVRENFLSADNQYYQKVSVQEDIYGFGKTVQYLLSTTDVEPPLRKIEELRLKNMISRCINRNSKKCYQTIQEVSEHSPNNRIKNTNKKSSLQKVFVCTIVLMGFAVIAAQAAGREVWNKNREKDGKVSEDLEDAENNNYEMLEEYRGKLLEKQEQWDIERREIEEKYVKREKELTYELALLYFIELEDYYKSRDTLESIGEAEAFTEDFIKLCMFMSEQEPVITDEDMEQLLERLKMEVPDPEDERYAYCVSKGYERLKEKKKEAEELQNAEVVNEEVPDAEAQNVGAQETATSLPTESGSQNAPESQ